MFIGRKDILEDLEAPKRMGVRFGIDQNGYVSALVLTVEVGF